MTDRLALLRAILAAPDDDTPRLIYADWLDEHGTTDADEARVEYIRLTCGKGQPAAIRPPEATWLDANWRRLVVRFEGLAGTGFWSSVKRTRRVVPRWAEWDDQTGRGLSLTEIEFRRGFVGQFRFRDRRGYERFRRVAAEDDPLAVLTPRDLPRTAERGMGFKAVIVYPDDWGSGVFDRLSGWDAELPGCWKRYVTHPHAIKAPPAEWDPQHRARQALGDAMTALSREWNGLAPTEVA